MTNENKTDDLMKLVNNSGFLFQLRIESEVASTSQSHGWNVITREQPWYDKETGREGFIDLILGKGRMRMVIECKRTKDADWVFLLPGEGIPETQIFSVYASRKADQPVRWGVSGFYPTPQSPIAEFCVVRGRGEGDSPLLERMGRTLLASVEKTAVEELSLLPPDKPTVALPGDYRIYFPLIVTNAQLHICSFDISNVSLRDGRFVENAQFQAVPFVRFRKSLATRLTPEALPDSLNKANRDMTRTILVVNSDSLVSMLAGWNLQTYPIQVFGS